jgi:thiol-disulfide isomerase/thioredoxin
MSRRIATVSACVVLAAVAVLGACRGRAGRERSGVISSSDRKGEARGGLLPATSADVLKAVQQARGDVVLVNVWATWCEPCQKEFPALLRLNRELRGKRFKLILVSADFPDLRPQVERFLADRAVDFPTFLKVEADDQFINALEPRWSGALPATILFDGSGARRQFWEGETSYDTFLARVSALLPGSAAKPASAAARADTHASPS